MRALSRSKTTLSLLTLTAFASSCGMTKNAERAASNFETAAANSGALLELNQLAYGDGRQGGARDRREAAMVAMEKATSLESKSVAAAAYLGAMEYQVYKAGGFREDDAEKLNRMIQEAVAEFVKVQKDFAKAPFVVETAGVATPTMLRDSLGNPAYLNAFAMAAALHKISERQLEGAKRFKFAPKSMLDILAEAIAAKPSVDADPKALAAKPAYIYEALRESDDVAGLIELRLNLMAGTGLAALGKSPLKKMESGALSIDTSAVKLQDCTDRLKAAYQAKMILSKGGISARLYADVEGGLKGLVTQLDSIPGDTLTGMNSPKLPQLMEIRALAEKISR